MNKERYNAYIRAWNKANHKRRNAHSRKWESNNRGKRRAHWLVFNALKKGLLKKKRCKECGSKVVHAHHTDYGKPLSVVWLCAKHHKQAHKKKA